MKSLPILGSDAKQARIELVNIEEERRSSLRIPTQYISSLQTNVNSESITCMVHNLSDTGAMIETSMRELPDRFILDNSAQNLRKLCRVVWSCGELTGVEFIGSSVPMQ